MRKLLTLILFCPVLAMAQKPFINSISPTHVEVGQTVTITGSNLNNVNEVFFGGVSVTPSSTSANTVTALVPAGATHGPITVQTSDNYTVASNQQFFISFSGTDIANYDSEFLVSTGLTDAYDICMCDLDVDGKNDLAIAHNANAGNEVTVYLNNTTGTTAFTPGDFAISQNINAANNNTGAIAITCGDLNHDGAPELVYSSNGVTSPGDVFIYQNDGGGNMSFAEDFKLPAAGSGNRGARKVRITDIDGDGNPDIVVGNSSDGTIHVYRGNGNLTFNAVDEVTVTGTINTSSLNVADFNNDGRPDVVSLPFRESNQVISVLKNTSQPDNTSFIQQEGITTPAQRVNVETADFDGDGLIDIVATNQQLQRVTVYRNTTSGGDITFATGVTVNISGAGAWGVHIGDMNGDGSPDIIVGSTTTIDDLFVIENTSTSGAISFASPSAIPTTNTNQNVVVGDLNGDARPDIAFTHNIQLGNPGNLGIFLNRNCVEPVITPSDIEFCTGDLFTVYATKSEGAIYDWQIAPSAGNSVVNNGDNADITINSGTSVTVTVTITHDDTESYECAQSGNATFTIIGGSQPAAPTFDAGASDDICVGDAYSIDITGGVNFDEFEWTLPDGSIEVITPGVASSTASYDLTSASVSDAGIYKVRGREDGGCYTDLSADFNLTVSQPPTFDIRNTGLDNFCATASVDLEVPDFPSDFTYQWKLNGSTDLGTTATQTVTQSGDYTVVITEQGGAMCSYTTPAYTVNAIAEPVSTVDGPSETCVGIETAFTAASTGQSGFTLTYEWQVDGSPVTPTDPTQLLTTFNSTGAHTVTLTTAYDPAEVDACSDVQVFNVTVSEEPIIAFDVTDGTEKCPSDVIPVTLTSPSSGTIDTYEWAVVDMATTDTVSTASTATVDASTPQGVDGVWVISRITTTIGCQVQDTVTIQNFANSNLAITEGENAVSDTTVNGTTYPLIELTDANFTDLTASGGTNYSWTTDSGTSDNFDNPDSETTNFFPSQPLTLVTLSGTDGNNCDETYTIAVFLDNFRPRKTFSPNGDGMNDCWEILNIGSFGDDQECTVFIFDSRGRTIQKVESSSFNDPNDNCVWDGNFNNSPVPEGVYYFVMKCEGSNVSKSGSILLAR